MSRGVCLVLVWMLLRAGLVSASPAPASGDGSDILHSSGESLSRRAQAQFRTFPATYEGRVEKGAYLKSLFPLKDKDAERANDGHAVVSPWQDPKALTRWGWTTRTKWAPFPANPVKFDENVPTFRNLLNIPFADPAHRVDPSKNALCVSKHNQPFLLEDGKNGQALCTRTYSTPPGAILFDSHEGPEYMKARYRKGDVPELSHVSDVVYFQWLEACREKNVSPRNIRTIWSVWVTYAPAFGVVQQAVRDAGKQKIPAWNERLTFSMDTRQGLAILGSTPGAASALLLIQHKETLGLKKIKDVTVDA
ncbi:hypothetical protein LX32DRAFT_697499 [Colletotrichum zoysiae]|uniref:Uncharacterized protein n=1 Tax=Colletotrichum zoysiae TaxID=1216348 RepID=A0AAD9H9R4_9PEZI|nr:hypothetical protein LX32DRAFT_697499 [Colletotrichum zoysiae]